MDDSEDNSPGLLAVAGPIYLSAATRQLVGELDQVGVEVVDGFPFGFGGGLARALPVLEGALGFVSSRFVLAQGGLD
jgi:hypothetical protein